MSKGEIATSKPSSPDDHKYDEYAVKRAVEVLMDAEEIKSDKKMMALVNAQMNKKHSAIKKIKSVSDLKDAAYEASKPEVPDEDEAEDDE